MTKKENKNDALTLVLLRNAFYRDSYRRAISVLLLVLIIDIALAITVSYLWINPPKPQYFAATADGRIVNIHPLSDPVVTNSFVLQWSADAVRKTYSLNFVHWKAQLQAASNYFTPDGWKAFLSSLKASNNLNTIREYNMVTKVDITAAPQLAGHAVIGGRYFWKVNMPIEVTYTNGDKQIFQTGEVTLLVTRMPVWQNPDRIAINNFIVNLRGKANA